MTFIIFPNQLFELKYYPKDVSFDDVHILEEPVYFGFRETKMNFNKLKLVLHRASMKFYESYLKDNNIKVEYHDFLDLRTKKNYQSLKKKLGTNDLYTFELNDHYLEKKILEVFPTIKFVTNPNFLVSKSQLNDYYLKNKSKKTIVMGNFNKWIKDQINVLVDVKSYDTENRNPLPNSVKIPVLGTLKPTDKKFLKDAIEYINNHTIFKNNCGPSNLDIKNCWFPVTFKGSKEWLDRFIKERLDRFGTYQDAIRDDHPFMFHSLIAPMFNIGLLSPHQIIDETMKIKDNPQTLKKVGINNIEGFLRQIIGWREYQRYCYLYYYDQMTKANIFKNNRLLGTSLYDGTTGVSPVDNAIQNAFQNGYIHHIQRLMVVSNFFNLLDIMPDESYKWFMEFSLDSYDWLMIQNVYSMGMWADGGLTMRKPYISTATYILNMSNYKKPKITDENDFDWTETWRALFYRKIIEHRKIFEKTPYIFQIKIWDKMDIDEKNKLLKMANQFIEKNTLTK
jgi:deoxyribodipyrimidine photolyase-related protein